MKLRGVRSGFSLMELLIVTVILPVVALAIFSNFASGLRLWRSIGAEDVNEETSIFMQRVGRDLEQGYKEKERPFEGAPQKFTISTLVETSEPLGGLSAPGRAAFSYDARGRAIVRETFDAHQLSEERPGRRAAVKRNVESFRASYLVYDKERRVYEWLDEVEAEKQLLPAAIRFEMEVRVGSKLEPVARVFYVPAGD